MYTIPLLPKPNQQFAIVLDEIEWGLHIRVAQNTLIVSVYKDGELIIDSVRPGAFNFLLPYTYQYTDSGNFIFATSNDEYPDYTKFGVTHFLIYVSKEELKGYKKVNYTYTVNNHGG